MTRFGIAPTSTSIVVLTHDDKSGSKMAAVHKKIKGNNVELSEIAQVRDVGKIKQVSRGGLTDDSIDG